MQDPHRSCTRQHTPKVVWTEGFVLAPPGTETAVCSPMDQAAPVMDTGNQHGIRGPVPQWVGRRLPAEAGDSPTLST